MRRTRTELVATSLLVAALSVAATARAQDDAARVEARGHFDRGVALSKARDYEAALREFELAYAAVPHYGVLYNIGQAQVAMGRSADAAVSFQKYLDDGGAAIDAGRRAEVEETLARLRPSSSAAVTPAPSDEPAPPPPLLVAPPAARPAPDSRTISNASGMVVPVKSNAPPHSAARSSSGSHRPSPSSSSSSRTVAYVLGGASLALGGAALGHYFWNRGRYYDWQADHRDYQRAPSESQRRELNEVAESISSASLLTVALCVGASVTLGTSAVLFVSSRPATPEQGVDATESTIGVRGRF